MLGIMLGRLCERRQIVPACLKAGSLGGMWYGGRKTQRINKNLLYNIVCDYMSVLTSSWPCHGGANTYGFESVPGTRNRKWAVREIKRVGG